METENEERFPWVKEVVQSFTKSFTIDYDSNILSVLHWNIDKEIQVVYSSNHHTSERAEALYKEITNLYQHMRLKISQHSEFQNATLSCVKLIAQLIKIGLVLTQGLTNSEWIERILTAIELFPGKKTLVYDALLLVNGLKKYQRKPYSEILRCILTENHHEYITDPLVYMEIALLFRRLKAIALDRYKERYTLLMTRIKPPSNLISWLASLDINSISPYLKNLQYKKIALQLMKKNLPESFLKKIRYMALNPYNFKIERSEFKIAENEEHPLDLYIIDDSGANYDNMDILANSQKTTKKKKSISQTNRKRKRLQINKCISIKKDQQSEGVNKNISKFDVGLVIHKHFPKSNEHAIVSKEKHKSKSKHNLVKNTKPKASINFVKDMLDSAVIAHGFRGSSTSQKLDENIMKKKDLESNSENEVSYLCTIQSSTNVVNDKLFSKSDEHVTVSKRKQRKSKHNLVKNTESKTSAILDEDTPVFFYDVEQSSTSKKFKSAHNVSNSSISSKRAFSDDAEINADQNVLKKKSTKKLKSSKYSKLAIADNSISNDDKIGSHESFVSENRKDQQENLLKDNDVLLITGEKGKKKNRKKQKLSKNNETISDSFIYSNCKITSGTESLQPVKSVKKDDRQENSDEDVPLVAEISEKKRKKAMPKKYSAISSHKCMYFKKLMLKKVSDEAEISSGIMKENSKMSDFKEKNKIDNQNIIEDMLDKNSKYFALDQSVNLENLKENVITNMPSPCNVVVDDQFDNSIQKKNVDNLLVRNEKCMIIHSSEKTESVMKPKSEQSVLKSATIKECIEMSESLNLKLEKEEKSVKIVKSDVLGHIIDTNVTAISDVKYKVIEDNLKETKSQRNLDSISNTESNFLPVCPNMEGNENTCKAGITNMSIFSNTGSTDLLHASDDCHSNQNQQISDQNMNMNVAANSNTSCEGFHNNAEHSTDFNNSSLEKNLCPTILVENQINVPSLSDKKLHQPASFDLAQSKALLDDDKIKNAITVECSTENSNSESELGGISKENRSLNESFNNIVNEIQQLKTVVHNALSNINDVQTEIKKQILIDIDAFKNYDVKVEKSSVFTEEKYQTSQNLNIVGKDLVSEKCNFPTKDDLSIDMPTSSQIKNSKDCNLFENVTKESKDSISGLKILETKSNFAEILNIQSKQNSVVNEKIKEIDLKIKNSFVAEDLNYVNQSQLDEKCGTLLPENNCPPDIPSSNTFNLKIAQSMNQSTETVIEEKEISKLTSEIKDVESVMETCDENELCKTLHPSENKEINKQIENKCEHSDSSLSNHKDASQKKDAQSSDQLNREDIREDIELLNNSSMSHKTIEEGPTEKYKVSNQLEAVNSQNISHKNNEKSISNENILSSNESTCSDNINNSENDFQIPEKIIIACENSDKLNAIHSQADIMIDNENNELDLSDKNILSSKVLVCPDNINNSANIVETSAKGIENTMQLESGNVLSACKNSDKLLAVYSQNNENNKIDLSIEENIPSIKTICLDNASNSVNDVTILLDEVKDTLQSLLGTDWITDTIDNSGQLKADNSQDNIISKEKNIPDKNLSSVNCLSTHSNLVNDKISMEGKENESKQLSLESKNVESSPSKVEVCSPLKRSIKMKNPNLHSTEATFCEIEEYPEKDSHCESEFQEQFIVIDESNSDIEDSILNYSEQSLENSSPSKNTRDSNCERLPLKASDGGNDASESKFKEVTSSSKASCKSTCENYNEEIEHIPKENSSKISFEKCEDKIESKNHEPIKDSLLTTTKISNESILIGIKKDLLSIVDDCTHSLKDCISETKLITSTSVVKNDCTSLSGTESSKQLELKSTEVSEQITKNNPSEGSESIFVPSFCNTNSNFESFSEISFKNKDKNIDVHSIGPVPIKNFSSAASTELFSMYRNELIHDEDKTDASLSSRDGILSNCQENDEIKSQNFSSDHSDEDIDSKYFPQEEEEKKSEMNEKILSEDCNIYSKNVDDSILSSSIHSPATIQKDDSPETKNCSDDTITIISDSNVDDCIDNVCEKKSVDSILPRQSLRLKNKTDSKCQTNSEESTTSDILEALQTSKKESKLVITDCTKKEKNEDETNNLCSSVKTASNYSVTPDNNENSNSSQTSVIEKNLSASEIKSKDSSVDSSAFDKRYSLRCRKSNKSKDNSTNLGIDLSKLKFDSPKSRTTRSKRESKFVKLLTSNVKLQNNPSDPMSPKRERISSTKSDVGLETDTPSYNLRNRKSIIAPAKLKI